MLLLFFFIFLLPAGLAEPEFYYKETDLINLKVDAFDEDGDALRYRFSSPLSPDGVWQTTYGDAGTYSIHVEVSDGKTVVTESMKVHVTKKNRAPVIDTQKVTVTEGELVDLLQKVSDPDRESLKITFSQPLDAEGRWQTDFTSAGDYTIEITASDTTEQIKRSIQLEVIEKNRAPTAKLHLPASSKEGQVTKASVEGYDADGDALTIEWLVDSTRYTDEEIVLHWDFKASGVHTVQVTVSDGKETVVLRKDIIIENTNRHPELTPTTVTVKEGLPVKFNLPEYDIDGDKVTYTISPPFENGVWVTDYDDAGSYQIRVVGTDGDLETAALMRVIVENMNRPPVLELGEHYYVSEGETISIPYTVTDPDGESVQITHTFPSDAIVTENSIEWSVSYDNIYHNWWYKMLRFFNKEVTKKFYPSVRACDPQECVEKTLQLTIKDVNRLPVIAPFETLIVEEGAQITFSPAAYDPDGDKITYSFSSPAESGQWLTTFDDAGEYNVEITASDGEGQTKYDLPVLIKEVNRRPLVQTPLHFSAAEGQKVTFPVKAYDEDGDEIEYYMDDLPPGARFEKNEIQWTIPHDTVQPSKAAASITLMLEMDDGKEKTSVPITIEVKHENQHPVIKNVSSTPSVFVGEPVIFSADVIDPDDDALEYEWNFGLSEPTLAGTPSVERVFTTEGLKQVELRISDGTTQVEYVWNVQVASHAQRDPKLKVIMLEG